MPFDNSDRRGRGRGTGERAINLPPAVMWLIGINVAVQLLRSLLGEETDNVIILMFGLVPAAYTGGSSDLLTQIASPITYQFLHGGWMHLVINMVTLAAFGAPVERMLGVRRFVLFYLSAGIVAGFVQVVLYPDSVDPVIGASGAISGVFGAVLMLMRYTGNLALSDRRHLDRHQRLLRPVRRHAGRGRRADRLAAHVGGFVYGLLAIRFFAPRRFI